MNSPIQLIARCAATTLLLSANLALAAAGDYAAGWGTTTTGRTVLPNATTLKVDFEAPRQAIGTNDGGMVVAGWGNSGFNLDSFMLKHTSTGAFDATFGKRIVRFANQADDSLIGVAQQADGKLVAVGATFEGSYTVAVVARFNSDGSPDATFGSQGWTTIPRFGDHGTMEALGVIIDSSNRIVVVGNARASSQPASSGFMSRLTSTGAMDGSFGTGGTVALQAPAVGEVGGVAGNTTLFRLVQQPGSGHYVVTGWAYLGVTKNSSVAALARVSSVNGTLDTTFGTSGWTLRDLADRTGCPNITTLDNCATFPNGIAAYSDGRLAVVGLTRTTFAASTTFNVGATPVNTDAAYVDWFTAAGATDGTRPLLRYALKSSDHGTSAARDAVIDGSGNLFVATQTFGVAFSSYVGVAKFTPAGALATSFTRAPGGTGAVVLDGISMATLSSGDVRGISLDGSGNVKIGGRGRNTHNNDGRPRSMFTLQFTSTGALNTSYDSDGYAATPLPRFDAQGRVVVVNPALDGELLLVSATQDASDPTVPTPAGTANTARARQYKILLTKLTPAGLPDNGFGVSGSLVVPRLGEAADVAIGSMTTFFPRAAARITRPADLTQPRHADDGKYLVTGQCGIVRSLPTPTTVTLDGDACVVRLLANGSVDSSFNAGGTPGYLLFGAVGFGDIGYAMRLHTSDSDPLQGKIVLAVQSSVAGGTNTTVVRLNDNGTLDTTFNAGGTPGSLVGTLPAGVLNFNTFNLRIDGSGRYLVSGHLQQPATGAWEPSIIRMLNTGVMDTSFGNAGVFSGFPNSYEPAGDVYSLGMAVYSANGRILLSGSIDADLENPRKTRAYIMAINPSGVIDPSFGDDGLVLLDDDANTLSSEGWLVFIESGGRVIAGTMRTLDNADKASEMRMHRFNFDGSVDTSFNAAGTPGYKTLSFAASSTSPPQPQKDIFRAANVDSAGNYYLFGAVWDDASEGRVPAVAKLAGEAIMLNSTSRTFYGIRSGQPTGGTYQAQYVYEVTNRSASAVAITPGVVPAGTPFDIDTVLCATGNVPDVGACSTNGGVSNVIGASFVTPCGGSLAAGGKCHVLVSFRPDITEVGYTTATLNIGDLKAPLAGFTCQMDLDRDTSRLLPASVEGLLYLRYMFGLRGAALVNGVTASAGGSTSNAGNIEGRIARQMLELDLDGDNSTLALRDGLMLLRAMLGLKGTAVTNGAANLAGSRPNWDAIQNHLRYTCGYALSLEN